MLHHRLLAWVVLLGLACGSTPGDDQLGPSIGFAALGASYFEDPGDEFTINSIVVTDPVGVAKVGVRVSPLMGDPEVNVVGRTIYSPSDTNISVSFPWAEVAPMFTTGSPAKKVSVLVTAVDVFGNVSMAVPREHTIRSRALWSVRPGAEPTLYPVFVDSSGAVWLATGRVPMDGRIVRLDPSTGVEVCAVAYFGEQVTNVTEAPGAGPGLEDLIVFGTSAGVRAVMRDNCLTPVWNMLDGVPYNGRPVYEAARTRIVALNASGEVVLIEAATGAVISRTPAVGAAYIVSPAVTPAGNIYAGSFNGNMFRYASDMTALPAIATQPIEADPVTSGNLIYFGARDGNIYPFDDSAGGLAHAPFLIALGDPILSRPALAPDGTILTTTMAEQKLFALEPDSGDIIWQASVGSVALGGPVVSDDGGGTWTAYIGNATGILNAVDHTGAIVWRLDAADAITTFGAISGRTLYINTIQTVYAIDIDPPSVL